MKKHVLETMLACALLPLATPFVHAQTARFSGQVIDPAGAAVPNADVLVLNLDTASKIQTKTDGAGSFVVPYLPAGHYRIEVQASSFSEVLTDDLTLADGEVHLLNIRLKVGSAEATVDVSGNANITQVNTENAEISGLLNEKQVTTLQLNGRNFTQLIALTPGVSNQTQQDEAKVGVLGSVAFSVNGGRTEYNSFSVDGAETLNTGINRDHSTLVVYPSVDAIQEIKVLTSNYGAEYPSTGNGTTLVTTKSGADEYHGLLYEFLRNEALNAKGYFDVGSKAPKYRRNDFGGTIGGPLTIPHRYQGKGKTHFFFSEESRLETTPTPYHLAVPSLAERGGDFSDVCPYMAPGGQAFFRAQDYPDCPAAPQGAIEKTPGAFTYPGNQVPVADTSSALLQTGVLPPPNSHSGCNSSINSCYLADVPFPTYFREELLRLDHDLTSHNKLTFRYIHDEWDTTTPIPQYSYITNSFPTIQNRFYGPGISVVGHWASTLSGSLVNDLGFNYVNSEIKLTNVPGAHVSLARPAAFDAKPCAGPAYGSTGLSSPSCGLGYFFNNGFGGKAPGIAIGGTNAAYGGTGFNIDPAFTPWIHTNPVYQVSDGLLKTVGRHTLQFGAEWVIWQRNQTNGPIGAANGDTQGLLTFSNQRSLYTSGNAFADFLSMAGISSYQQDSAQFRYHQRYQIAEPYIQDDWKVNSRLTINAGLRFSLFGTYREAKKQAYNWTRSAFSDTLARSVQVSSGETQGVLASGQLVDRATQSAVPTYLANGSVNPILTNGVQQCGANGVPDGCMKGHLLNPAPRVGFAWDPFGSGKTSIRGGYGIFFEHGTADEANTGSLEGSAPAVLSMTQLNINTLSCVGNLGAGCSAAGPGAFPLNVTAIPTKAVWPYVQQWSISAERELTKNVLATAAYVGSKGTHLTVEREINQLLPAGTNNPFGKHDPFNANTCKAFTPNNGSGGNIGGEVGAGYYDGNSYHLPGGEIIAPSDPAYINMQAACNGEGFGGVEDPNAQRQFAPGLGEIFSLENIATSAYNSFQAEIRLTRGPMTLGGAYTFSHSLDDASDRSDTTFTNSYDLEGTRASSNFDQRHLLHISYIYDLPLRFILQRVISNLETDPNPDDRLNTYPADHYFSSRLAKVLLDHWQLSGITLVETGIPFTVVNGGSTNGVSVLDNAGVYNGVGAGSYPDLVGNPKAHRPKLFSSSSAGPLLLNPGAFAAPRGLTFGNAGRNSLNNPSRTNWDMTLQKVFALPREGTNLTFRAEAFNVFNQTQFRIYNPTLGNQSNNTVSCYANSVSNASTAAFSAAGGDGTNCLTNSNFLHAIDAHRPRTIQLGLKLAF